MKSLRNVRKNLVAGLVVLSFLVVGNLTNAQAASYTATDMASLAMATVDIVTAGSTTKSVAGTTVYVFSGIINGRSVSIESPSSSLSNSIVNFYVNGTQIGSIDYDAAIAAYASGGSNMSGSFTTLWNAYAQALGVSISNVASLSNPNSPSAMATNLVFENLVMPSPKTAKEKTRDIRQAEGLRTFGANMRTEFVNKDNDYKGQIYGFNFGFAYDINNFTFGIMLPYQNLDYNVLDAHRIGTVLFAQYHIPVNKDLKISSTINFNYLYTGPV